MNWWTRAFGKNNCTVHLYRKKKFIKRWQIKLVSFSFPIFPAYSMRGILSVHSLFHLSTHSRNTKHLVKCQTNTEVSSEFNPFLLNCLWNTYLPNLFIVTNPFYQHITFKYQIIEKYLLVSLLTFHKSP